MKIRKCISIDKEIMEKCRLLDINISGLVNGFLENFFQDIDVKSFKQIEGFRSKESEIVLDTLYRKMSNDKFGFKDREKFFDSLNEEEKKKFEGGMDDFLKDLDKNPYKWISKTSNYLFRKGFPAYLDEEIKKGIKKGRIITNV